MATTGNFWMPIESGLIGDRVYGGCVEYDRTKTERENILSAVDFDTTTGAFNWNFQNINNLVPTALANIRDNEWQTSGVTGRRWTVANDSRYNLQLATSSFYYPPTDNPVITQRNWGDYWYALRFTMPSVGVDVFIDAPFALNDRDSIIGYNVDKRIPLLSFNESNGQGNIQYYMNPDLAPAGFLMFWELINGEPTPTRLFYLSVQYRGINNPPVLIYREIIGSIIGELVFEEEEEMLFPESKLYNMFTTMYGMTFAQVEGLAQLLIDKADDYSGTMSFMQKLLDDMGFSTGVVTDAIIDLTVYPFDVDMVCDYATTRYLKLGYGSDQVTGEGANLGIFHYDDSILHKLTYLNTGALEMPSGNGINFDQRVGRFNDFRDYPPYRTFEMYIPYVGIVPVDQRKLYGKSLKLKYIVDFYSGNATALLLAYENGEYTILESYDCVMGVHQAVSTTNWAEYASRMNTAKSQVMNAGLGLGLNIATGNPKGIMESLGAGMNATRSQATSEGIYTGNVNGTSSSMSNYYMPLNWYIFDYQQETSITGNLNSLSGRVSNTSGAISSFTGFLQVKDVDLVCAGATESEKAEIIGMLERGVRI